MHIRPAELKDADAAADLLRRSIHELCVQDHGNDPAILDPWLANKTPEAFAQWLANSSNRIFVAETAGRLLGVCCARTPDEVLLNYIAPEARFQGVSKALMAAVETALHEAGARQSKLMSTRTAREFYLAIGYTDLGFTETHGIGAFEMRKDL